MVKRDTLIHFIYQTIGADLLGKAEVKDEMPNGVQILGGEDVAVVTLGVSLNEEFLKKAVKHNSNFSIFHHGFDPRTYKSCYGVSSQKRLRLIFQNNITIMGFHYSLDAHSQIGNNAQIIQKLGAKIGESLYEEWGYVGKLLPSQSVGELKANCEKLFGRKIFHFSSGKDMISTIGVVSGAGKLYHQNVYEFEKKGIQLYISGETSESRVHVMKESCIDYFICGHYATEVFGVQALGEKIKNEFGDQLEVKFIEVENPI